MFNGKIHYKWQFSIAMLNYQRVSPNILSHQPGYSFGCHHVPFRFLQLRFGHLRAERFLHGRALEVEQWIPPMDLLMVIR